MLPTSGSKEVAMGIYKRPDSKKWWISYYHNGERVREGVSTNKRQAEKVLMQRLTAINENKHPVLRKRKNKKIKFVDFAEKYIKEHAKPTKKSYRCDISRLRNLIPYFGDLYLHEIESYHIVEYRKLRLQEKAANRKNLVNPGTVNREVGLLRSMINLASEWFDLELKPIKYEMAKEEPKERILTEQEIRRLVENSEAPLRHIKKMGSVSGNVSGSYSTS
jgi:hypothetical protein